MRVLADRVILAEGWARAALAVASGAIGALAMPPFGFWPALAVSLTVAVWLLDGSAAGERFRKVATLRRAAVAGWLWGFGYFVAGLWWIGAAFLVEADVFAWLLPFGVLGLPALLAAFPAFGFALARALWSPGAARLFALAFGLTTAEWLRGHLFTGFPWNTLGLAFGQDVWTMQSASVLGLYGLTALVVLTLASPAMLGTAETRVGRLAPVATAAVALVAVVAYGVFRVPAEATPAVSGVNLRILQPNLPQDAKFRPSAGGEILARYLELSGGAPGAGPGTLASVTHLVWPESAFPFLLHREPVALASIAAALGSGAVLVTGAAREGEALPGESGRRFYNSVQVVDGKGAIVATYDKTHLVPFGEYVPTILDRTLRGLGLRQFVHMPGGFTPGERRAALAVPGLPAAAASVCYEAIFPGEALPEGPRPGLLLNVTNDGWFGDTPGPHQHFAQARLRAVETGLPLVRAANTGISAVVDPYGRILASLGLGHEGVLDSPLPQAIAPPPAARYGATTTFSLLAACLGVAFVGRMRSI